MPDSPCFDLPTWQDGYQRGYAEGKTDGEHLGERATRTAFLDVLETYAYDLKLGLVHDAEPLQVLRAVMQLVAVPEEGAHASHD